MNFEEYRQKHAQYERFAKEVKKLLYAALKDSKLNLQVIQARAKTLDSLEKRLIESGNRDADNIEEIRNDLAGCRLIFYFNGDVDSFLGSPIIRDNFKVHWEKSKPHYPKGDIAEAKDLYIAHHYIVELDETRASLPEYAEFKGLKCEIQVQTLLNHAMAETGHDVIYKRPKTDGFGTKIIDSIEKRLVGVMRDHLLVAGYEFQRIQHDYERLLAGKAYFDREIKKEIVEAKNNNERDEILTGFKEHALPIYDRETLEQEFMEIIDTARTAIAESKKSKTVEIETPFGNLAGKTSLDILKVALSVVEFVQYVNVEAAIAFLIELYVAASDEDEKKAIEEAANKLASFDLNVLRKAGLVVQDFFLTQLESQTDPAALGGFILTVCAATLEANAETTSGNWKSITITNANLSVDSATRAIRGRAINLIKKTYGYLTEESKKRLAIAAFNNATRPPFNAYNDDMLVLIQENTAEIIHFYRTLVNKEAYEILESIEEDVCHLYQRAKGVVEAKNSSEAAAKSGAAVIEASILFRDELNKNDEFVVYKTLVGYESVFPQSWDNPEWGFTKETEFRESKIQEFIDSISKETWPAWTKIILRCAQTKSDDLATFPVFGKFLNLLAHQKPDSGVELIQEHETELKNFLGTLIDGLLHGSKLRGLALMHKWVDAGKHLYTMARVFEYYVPLDKKLLKKIFEASVQRGDADAIIKVMAAVAKNSDDNSLVGEFFLPALKELTKLGVTYWIHDYWWRQDEKVISKLDQEQVKVVLDNLLLLDKIDYHAEEILRIIAKNFPKSVIDYFGRRLERGETDE